MLKRIPYLLAIAAFLMASPLGAQTPEERRNIMIMPRIPLYLHLDATSSAMPDPRQVQRALLEHLRQHPYVAVVANPQIFTRLRSLPNVEGHLLQADSDRQSGIQLFFHFDFTFAVRQLEFALRDYQLGYGELLEPDRLAEVYQYLAFSLLEQMNIEEMVEGEVERKQFLIQQYLENLVRLAPDRIIDAARQPPERVQLYRQARRAFLDNASLRNAGQREQAEMIAAAMRNQLDYILFARIVQQADATLLLELRVYDTYRNAFTFEDDIPLPFNTAAAAERSDALLSRFTSCIPPRIPPTLPIPSEQGRLYLDLAFSYMQFLEHPASNPFDNLGASVHSSYMLTEHFSVISRFSISFSGRDQKGELLQTFNTLRARLGVGLSKDFRWIRLYFHTGLEITTLSDFNVTRDLSCRAYGINDPDCNRSAVDNFRAETLSGLGSSIGLNLGYDPAFLVAQISSAFYFLPFNSAKNINFPMSFEVGAQYRFF